MARELRVEQPPREGEVDAGVDKNSPRRAQSEQEHGSDDGTEQNAKTAKCRVQSYCARQLGRADNVSLQHELFRRLPYRSSRAVNDEEDGGAEFQ